MPATASPIEFLSASNLVPGPGLAPTADGWEASAAQVRFESTEPLDAGWYEVKLGVRSAGRFTVFKRADLCFPPADTNPRPPARETFAWNRSFEECFTLRLARPSAGVRLDLHRVEGGFSLTDFEIRRLTPREVLKRAVTEKFRLIRSYRCVRPVLVRGGKMLLSGRFKQFSAKLYKGLIDARQMRRGATDEVDAAWWRRHTLSTEEAERIAKATDEMVDPPPIAVILPVDARRLDTAQLAAHSVRRQIYPHWELHLCAAGPAGLEPHLNAILGPEPRVRIHRASRFAGLPAAVARAVSTTECERVVVLPPGVELAEHALFHFADAIRENPIASLLGGRVYQAHEVADAADKPIDGEEAAAAAMVNGDGAAKETEPEEAEEGAPKVEKWTIPPAVWIAPTRVIADAVPRRLSPKTTADWTTSLAPVAERTVLPPVLAYPIEDRPLLDRFRVGRKPQETGRLLYLSADLRAITGYDHLAFAMLKGLATAGLDLRLHQVNVVRADLVPPGSLPPSGGWEPGMPQLIVSPPFLAERFTPDRASAIFTMWETDRIDPAHVAVLNRAGLVVVPSQWGVDCFRDCGVTVPMAVAPLGYDPLVFNPGNAPFPEFCTFGTAGALAAGGLRKNAQKVIDLFRAAFPTETDVKLRVKITPSSPSVETYDDPRVEVIRAVLPHGDLADWYRSLTAYVNASTGEGFGLHLIEAMACGRPLITPNYSGLTAFFDPSLGYAVDYDRVPVNNAIYSGTWAEPRDESIVARMREVYADRETAKRLGEKCAARAKRFTWKDAGRALMAALDGINPGERGA